MISCDSVEFSFFTGAELIRGTFFYWEIISLTTSLSTGSGTFRGEGQRAKADEWEKITGAELMLRTCRMVCTEVWERSMSMPSRLHSRTTSWETGEGKKREVNIKG